MSGTKEADLISAILLYAVRCLAEGDHQALRGMNFGPQEMDALSELSVQDLYRVDSMQAHCLEIRLNRQVYWPLVNYLKEARESEMDQQALIRAGAPFEMMQSLFGMSMREYNRHRRQMVVDVALGRPPEPEEPVSHSVYEVWASRFEGQPVENLTSADYLELHEETGESLRVIWKLTERWSEFGSLDLEDPVGGSPGKAQS